MRRALALALALAWSSGSNASLEDDGVWAAGVWATTAWGDGVWYEASAGTVAVPNVVGEANAAAADSILEGDGLDLGNTASKCSAATADEVIGQTPIAGTVVASGSLVDVLVSSGTECSALGGRKFGFGLGLGL